jgi:hypothetical protein
MSDKENGRLLNFAVVFPQDIVVPTYANACAVTSLNDTVIIDFGYLDPSVLTPLDQSQLLDDPITIPALRVGRFALGLGEARQLIQNLETTIKRNQSMKEGKKS